MTTYDTPPVQPIILGGDMGAYSLARAFHEAFGVTSTVISVRATSALRYSQIVRNVVEPELDNPDVMIRLIRRLAATSPAPTLALAGVDWYVRALSAAHDDLADVAAVPYMPIDVLDRVMDKPRFLELCSELGVPHAATEIRHGGDKVGRLDLRFPVYVKPGDFTAWYKISFPGKRKVHRVENAEELGRLLAVSGEAGYTDVLLVQEEVAGPDSNERSITTFTAADGSEPLKWGGQVVLEEHTPGALGNPAAIFTLQQPQMEEYAGRITRALGWRGFANLDFKIDAADGSAKVFELNPRTPRTNFYLTASGFNAAQYFAADYLGIGQFPHGGGRSVLYHTAPRHLLNKYTPDAARRRQLRQAPSAQPLHYWRGEHDPRRWAWVAYYAYTQYRNFRRYYPVPPRAGAGR